MININDLHDIFPEETFRESPYTGDLSELLFNWGSTVQPAAHKEHLSYSDGSWVT